MQLRHHHLATYRSHGVVPELVTAADRLDVVRQYVLQQMQHLTSLLQMHPTL